ncbi:MAG: 2'-5' RNA ligase family protein, partial [Burkholderiales bacterium]
VAAVGLPYVMSSVMTYRPKVGPGDDPRRMLGFKYERVEFLSTDGIKGEDRPYAPHVTLVRDAQRAPQRKRLEPFAWRADDFVLVESVSVHGGVRYDVIGRWRLAASAYSAAKGA